MNRFGEQNRPAQGGKTQHQWTRRWTKANSWKRMPAAAKRLFLQSDEQLKLTDLQYHGSATSVLVGKEWQP